MRRRRCRDRGACRSRRAAGRISNPPSLPRGVAVISARKRVENRPDRPFERLQHDVAGEAVGDDDVGGAAEDVATLGVAGEVEIARARAGRAPRARAGSPSRAPRRSRAAGPSGSTPSISAAKTAPIVANCSRCSGRASAFAPASMQDGRAVLGWDRYRDRRPHHAGDAPQLEQPGGEHGARVPGRDDRIGLPFGDCAHRGDERAVGLRAHGLRRLVVHLDHVRGRKSSRPRVSRPGSPKITSSTPSPRAASAPATISCGASIAAHRVDRDAGHGYGASMRSGSTSRPL